MEWYMISIAGSNTKTSYDKAYRGYSSKAINQCVDKANNTKV